jgi:LysR family transcriptional regulator (chromosome initiation inhibitor)
MVVALDYVSLSFLAAVIREGSFERAAQVLCVTSSAVSQRVRTLEERVGCALVVRGQPCRPTATGRMLCQHLDRVRLLEHDFLDSMPAFTNEETARPVLPLAVNADSLDTWFAPAVAAYAAESPVLLKLVVDDQEHTSKLLRGGEVLAGVTATPEPPPGFNCRPLGAMRYVAAASPSYMTRHFGTGVTVDSLAWAPSLVFNEKDELQDRWIRSLFGQNVVRPQHMVPSCHGTVTAAVAGMGWSMHPQSLITPLLREGALVELVPDRPLDVPLYWQYTRASSTLLSGLGAAIMKAASRALVPPQV